MYKKLIFTALLVSLLYILGCGTLAAPQTLEGTYTGTAQLVTVTNPNNGTTTFKSQAVVSVTGDEGVIVTLYTYNAESGVYELYTDKNGENSWFIGPSGIFVKRVPIYSGVNYIGVFAEQNGYDQFVIRRVDKGSKKISQGIKNILIKSMEEIVQTVNN